MIHTDIHKVLEAVRIDSDYGYTIQGESRHFTNEKPANSELPAFFSSLEGDLYHRMYTCPTKITQPDFDHMAERNHVTMLSAANNGKGTWEPGWVIRETADEDGLIAVYKDGLICWVKAEQLKPKDNHIVQGQFCRVRVGKELRGLMPGFYFAIGDGDEADRSESVGQIVRFYWHLKPGSAPKYIEEITTALNQLKVPFRTKTLTSPYAFTRADSAVLYLNRVEYQRALLGVSTVHQKISALLRPEAPLFCKRLADGLSIAEDPGNNLSFGQHRCKLIATAIWNSYRASQTDLSQKIAEVQAVFAKEGFDPERPYLQPGSPDIYTWPEISGKASMTVAKSKSSKQKSHRSKRKVRQ